MKGIIVPFLVSVLLSCSTSHKDTETTAQTPSTTTERNYYIDRPSEHIWVERHVNGMIKRIGEQGMFGPCGVGTGTHYHFDSLGNLTQQIVFDHFYAGEDSACHDIMTKELIIAFHPNGTIRSRQQLQYAYQGESYKTGDWIEYDEQGNEVSRKRFAYEDRVTLE